ncbi:hypothetical protein D3C87_1754300 [compost metagenome]
MEALGLLTKDDLRLDLDAIQSLLETDQPVDHRFPLGQFREHFNQISDGRMYFAEGGAYLGQTAE